MEKSVKIRNLVNETSEISLDVNQPNPFTKLIGIEAASIVGGQRETILVRDTYLTTIETRFTNGNIGIENMTDTDE
jgi:hypothetical protein